MNRSDDDDQVLLVFTHVGDEADAERLAQGAVEARLAACANIQAACRSVYVWQGNLELSREIPVHFKTTRKRYADLQRFIREHHAYELPEVLAFTAADGLAEYLAWVHEGSTPAHS